MRVALRVSGISGCAEARMDRSKRLQRSKQMSCCQQAQAGRKLSKPYRSVYSHTVPLPRHVRIAIQLRLMSG